MIEICIGELELRHHTCQYTSYTNTATNIYTYVHKPTLELELATLIRTDRAPRVAQAHQVGHHIKVSHTTPGPNPQPRSYQTHCPPHMTAGHHKIRVGSLSTHLLTQIWTKHLHMTDQFTLKTRSLISSHLSK